MHAFIRAIQYHLPEQILNNEAYFELFPEKKANDSLLKVGVKERHIISPGETASDLAVKAAEKLFRETGIDRKEVDFILFNALEFDYILPSTACLIQERLGIPKSCGSLDFNHGCSAYVYGLGLAKGLIETGQAKNVLFLTASSLTKTFHSEDKSSRFVFGDGAAATLVSGREKIEGIGIPVYGTDGSGAGKIIIRDGAGRHPYSESSFEPEADEFGNVSSPAHFYMNGTGVFLWSLKTVPRLVNEVLSKSSKAVSDIDLFVFHQANSFMNDAIRKKLGIPKENFFTFMESTGNTVAATIPIALSEAIRSGKINQGDTVLLAAFGVGLSWAGCLVTL